MYLLFSLYNIKLYLALKKAYRQLREAKKMKIGIDIDNTLTEVQKALNRAAFNYATELGKSIDESEDQLEDNANYYKERYKFSYDELKYFLKDIQEEIINSAKPRENVVKYINKLRETGNEIYIISARSSEFHDDPYKLSKDWLDNNNIKFDKLIVNARKKAPVCKQENIDIFIDDQLNNCIEVSRLGIMTIRLSEDETHYNNITNCKNWDDIYNCIIQLQDNGYFATGI